MREKYSDFLGVALKPANFLPSPTRFASNCLCKLSAALVLSSGSPLGWRRQDVVVRRGWICFCRVVEDTLGEGRWEMREVKMCYS